MPKWIIKNIRYLRELVTRCDARYNEHRCSFSKKEHRKWPHLPHMAGDHLAQWM